MVTYFHILKFVKGHTKAIAMLKIGPKKLQAHLLVHAFWVALNEADSCEDVDESNFRAASPQQIPELFNHWLIHKQIHNFP